MMIKRGSGSFYYDGEDSDAMALLIRDFITNIEKDHKITFTSCHVTLNATQEKETKEQIRGTDLPTVKEK